MLEQRQRGSKSTELPKKIINKTFYRFVFSFVAVVASVLFFILVLGEVVG
jgi:hypothetical protein